MAIRNPKGVAFKTKKGSVGIVVDITTLKKVPTWGEEFGENHREFYIKKKDNGKFSMFEIWDDDDENFPQEKQEDPLSDGGDDEDVPF